MLNRMQIEGIVLKTWYYVGIPFAQLINRPDPGQGEKEMVFIARLPHVAPIEVKAGDLLRMYGRFFNRPKDGCDEFIGEIHAEQVVCVARNKLRHKRKRQREKQQAAA